MSNLTVGQLCILRDYGLVKGLGDVSVGGYTHGALAGITIDIHIEVPMEEEKVLELLNKVYNDYQQDAITLQEADFVLDCIGFEVRKYIKEELDLES